MKELIEEEFPLNEVPGELERESLRHSIFKDRKLGFYIDGENISSILSDFVEKNIPCLLYGEKGSGLSASISYLSGKIEESNNFVFQHFCSASKNSNDLKLLLLRLCSELEKVEDKRIDINSDEEWLVENLTMILNEINKEIYIFIDDIDLLVCKDARSPLYWLPNELPSHVHIISSTHNKSVYNDALNRNMEFYNLDILDKLQKEKIINGYLQLYSKRLSSECMELLLSCSILDNPLTLRAVLDELRIFGLHEGLLNQIQAYVVCDNAESLYELIMRRIEIDFGEDIVKKTLSIIALTSNGIYENELLDILNVPRLKATPMLRTISVLLESTASLYIVRNDYIKKVIFDNYIKDSSYENKLRDELVKYGNLEGKDQFALRELPYQYHKLENWKGLAEYVTRVDVFFELSKNNPYFLVGYCAEAKLKVDLVTKFFEGYNVWSFDNDEAKIKYLDKLSEFLFISDLFSGAVLCYKKMLEIYEESDNYKLEKIKIRGRLGIAYKKMSNYKEAEELLENALESQTLINGELCVENIDILNELADLNTTLGRHQDALDYNLKALDCCIKNYGENHLKTAITYREIGWDYEYIDKYKESLESLLKALSIFRKVCGEEHIETISCLHAIAWVYDWFGDYDKVNEYALKAYEISSKLCGENHSLTAMSYKQLAVAEYRYEDYEKAYEDNLKALVTFQKLYQKDHSRISIQYFQIGLSLIKLKRYEEACDNFKKSIEMDIRILGNDHEGDFAISYNYYGYALALSGNFDEGEKYLLLGMDIAEKEYGKDSSDYADSKFLLGSLYFENGRKDEGLMFINQALDIRTSIFGEDNPETIEIKDFLNKCNN